MTMLAAWAEPGFSLLAADTRAPGAPGTRHENWQKIVAMRWGWGGVTGQDLGWLGPLQWADPADPEVLRRLIRRVHRASRAREKLPLERHAFLFVSADYPGEVHRLEAGKRLEVVSELLTVPPELQGESEERRIVEALNRGLPRQPTRADVLRAIGRVFAAAAERSEQVGPIVSVGSVRRVEDRPLLQFFRERSEVLAEASDSELEGLFARRDYSGAKMFGALWVRPRPPLRERFLLRLGYRELIGGRPLGREHVLCRTGILLPRWTGS